MARIRSLHDIQAEFADLPPVLQSEGPDTIVQIQYSDEYSQVMDIFRAVLKSKEYSPRALRLTEDAIGLNSSNYTVWWYRRRVLDSVPHLSTTASLVEELEFARRVAEESPKTYQVWYHRRSIVEKLVERGQASDELSRNELRFTECAFQSSDDKNYHAWAHRQWAVRLFSLWGSELEFTDRLIEADNRNNSAWNQRLWVLRYIDGGLAKYRAAELESLRRMLERVPNNTCGWHHLLAILPQDASVASYVPELVEIAEVW
mmetsp:Transcript_5280/g.19339  ORF Transcript_5280/g.19339 Transcript_5280/m.19339 type:complete len:260 (+) Transcript_5280:349-1128(+)